LRPEDPAGDWRSGDCRAFFPSGVAQGATELEGMKFAQFSRIFNSPPRPSTTMGDGDNDGMQRFESWTISEGGGRIPLVVILRCVDTDAA
jgi:hypothetical protein